MPLSTQQRAPPAVQLVIYLLSFKYEFRHQRLPMMPQASAWSQSSSPELGVGYADQRLHPLPDARAAQIRRAVLGDDDVNIVPGEADRRAAL